MGLSCLLIGDDNLLIQCGLLLLEKKYHIRWVISSTSAIQTWCDQYHIPCISSFTELSDDAEVDYLFSIVNKTVLSPQNLAVVRIAAINYHNSLLPTYAGLNATTWAMINHEKTHGITWHCMEQGLDAGGIVNQRRISISPSDTALTLNLKCFEEAINGFIEIVHAIEHNSLTSTPQDKKKRSYYGMNHVLPHLGFINWLSDTAEDILCLNKALSFGHYNNTVGSLKIGLGSDYLIVSQVELIDVPATDKNAGVILDLDKNGIVIHTKSRPVRIKELSKPNGQKLSMHEIAQQYGLWIGMQLPSFAQTPLTKHLYSRGLTQEKYWLEQLKNISEHNIFTKKVCAVKSDYQQLSPIALSQYTRKKMQQGQYHLLAAVLIYLYRLNDYERSTVFLVNPLFNQPNVSGLFAKLVPMSFAFNSDETLGRIVAEAEQQLNLVYNHEFYLTDIFARYPDLEAISTDSAITISFSHDKEHFPQHSIIHFVIDSQLNKLFIYHKMNSQLESIRTHMGEHLANILKSIINSPQLLVHQFSFLTQGEYQRIMSWSQGEHSELPAESIIELFECNVMNFPDNPAIYHNDVLSYVQVWEQVTKTAAFIHGQGVPEQTPIGIYLERGSAMLVTLLGILKAGCIYVPLDLKYPMRKIGMIVEEIRLTYLITEEPYQQHINDYFSAHNPLHVFNVHSLLNRPLTLKSKRPVKPQKNDLVYVMFTSGTTGIPKGVMVSQSNVLNYCYWFTQTTQFDSKSIIDFSSSLAFDLSISCTIAPLLAGGAIAICDDQQKMNPELYLEHAQRNQITHIELTPGYLEMLLHYPESIKKLTQLHYVLLGADVVHREEVAKWLSLCPQSQVINEYGPTETTVSATSYFVKDIVDLKQAAVPIGRPAFNTTCYVLDKYLNPCPLDMKGELYIGGAQVSEGYLNRSELTAQKFLKNTLDRSSKSLYKTGDLVSWLPEGVLQFFGRNDQQVKIQGYRIELPAIESILMKYKTIHQAVVVVRERKAKQKYLRAYLVTGDNSLTPQKIKEFLALHLPPYMHPKEFCFIPAIPLKENEKIDFDALEHQTNSLLTTIPSSITQDLSDTEQVCLSIWCNVFHHQTITLDDDFFALGGDSLIALHIVSALKDQYKINIPLSVLFERPNIALLADAIDELMHQTTKPVVGQKHTRSSSMIQLSSGSYATPLFLVHPVGGSVFWYQQLAQKLEGKYTIYGISDKAIDEDGLRFSSLSEMAHYYLHEIATVYQGETYCLGGASFGATVAVEMAQQLIRQQKKVEFLGLFDGWAQYPSILMKSNTVQLLTQDKPDIEQQTRDYLQELEEYRKQLLLDYSPKMLEAPITLFKAQELWESFASIDDPHNGWLPFIGDTITVHQVPGNHESMFFGSNAQILADHIILANK